MGTVKLSCGEYTLGEPTMAAWRRIFEALEDEHYAAIGAAVGVCKDLSETASESGLVTSILHTVLPVCRRFPGLLTEFAISCLRLRDGARVEDVEPDDLTGSDVFAIAKALDDNGTLLPLFKTAKNFCAPVVLRIAALSAKAPTSATP